jgi:hypothetical protein
MIDENLKRLCVLVLTALPIAAAVNTGNAWHLVGLIASVINTAFIYTKMP